jgi:hypothetical protein
MKAFAKTIRGAGGVIEENGELRMELDRNSKEVSQRGNWEKKKRIRFRRRQSALLSLVW